MTTGRWPVAEELATERLVLQPLREDHAEAMAAVLADRDLYLYTGGVPPSAEELTERYQRQSRGEAPDGNSGWLNWILVTPGADAAAGYVQATVTRADGELNADLAWVVGTGFQGSGFATEGAGAVASWLRSAGVASLTAHIHPENRASESVARKLGLVPGVARDDGEVRWSDEGAGSSKIARPGG